MCQYFRMQNRKMYTQPFQQISFPYIDFKLFPLKLYSVYLLIVSICVSSSNNSFEICTKLSIFQLIITSQSIPQNFLNWAHFQDNFLFSWIFGLHVECCLLKPKFYSSLRSHNFLSWSLKPIFSNHKIFVSPFYLQSIRTYFRN